MHYERIALAELTKEIANHITDKHYLTVDEHSAIYDEENVNISYNEIAIYRRGNLIGTFSIKSQGIFLKRPDIHGASLWQNDEQPLKVVDMSNPDLMDEIDKYILELVNHAKSNSDESK